MKRRFFHWERKLVLLVSAVLKTEYWKSSLAKIFPIFCKWGLVLEHVLLNLQYCSWIWKSGYSYSGRCVLYVFCYV